MESTSKAAYRECCREWPDLPIFAYDWFLDAACSGLEWQVALVEKGGEIAAALPYLIKRQGPMLHLTQPPLIKMLGPYLIPRYRQLRFEHQLYTQLIEQLPPHFAFKQLFHPGVTNWLPFYWKGFQQTTRYTYVIDFEENPDPFSRFEASLRSEIRKASSRLQLSSEGRPEEFYQINQLSFQRQGLSIPYSFDAWRRLDRALEDRQCRRLFFARDEAGQIHSVVSLIWDKQAAYYHLAGDHPDLRQGGGGKLLAWEAIRYTQEVLRLPRFDFEGSMLPGVEPVRRQFGARQLPYFMVWRYQNRFWEWIDRFRGKSPR